MKKLMRLGILSFVVVASLVIALDAHAQPSSQTLDEGNFTWNPHRL